MCFETQFKNTLTIYTTTNIIPRRLVLLPLNWDENDLLFTKWLQMMKMFIDYSNASRTIMSSIEIFSKHQVHETASAEWRWINIIWVVWFSIKYSCRLNTLVLLNLLATLILRAKYAGTAALDMLFWTPDILFNNALGLMNPLNKKKIIIRWRIKIQPW